MRFCLIFVIAFLLVYSSFSWQGCSHQQRGKKTTKYELIASTLPAEYCLIKKYPYIAPADYCRKVNENVEKIQIGDSFEKVCEILPPATILTHRYDYNHVYDPNGEYGPIGFEQVFIFERKQGNNASVKEQACVGYYFVYDLNRRVILFYSLDTPAARKFNKVKDIYKGSRTEWQHPNNPKNPLP